MTLEQTRAKFKHFRSHLISLLSDVLDVESKVDEYGEPALKLYITPLANDLDKILDEFKNFLTNDFNSQYRNDEKVAYYIGEIQHVIRVIKEKFTSLTSSINTKNV